MPPVGWLVLGLLSAVSLAVLLVLWHWVLLVRVLVLVEGMPCAR